uniref:Uncharacterized protein n=1 Tax=Meloidogyne enterolobii TaxID=390850 RepID=A0A6V7WTZ0_MELEN|nr:unnamed protein product [Meloidogyne enterolobii]
MAQAGPLPSKNSLNLSELRSRVLIGQLPDDFLRVSKPEVDPTIPQNVQEQQQNIPSIPQQVPYQSFGPAENFYSFVPPHTRGRLSIKIVEAKLTKNYGLPGVRMDPYIRLRIGHTLFETPTCVNGGKAPHWNRTVNAYLPEGVESVYLQIFDERAFTNDELVAWAHIILPQGIFNREVIDEWYQLSGPQGEGKEGVINLVVSFSQVPRPQNQGEERAIINAPLFTEEELNELAEMFPTIEREVIKQVLEAKGGVKEAAVTALLDICG